MINLISLPSGSYNQIAWKVQYYFFLYIESSKNVDLGSSRGNGGTAATLTSVKKKSTQTSVAVVNLRPQRRSV